MLHKQEKIIIPFFYNDYTTTHIGLSIDGVLVSQKTIPNKWVSLSMIPVFDELLKTYEVSIQEVSHFVLYRGPAPFTTLRSVISSVNALAYASKKTIYTINGMLACLWLMLLRKVYKKGEALCVIHEAFCGDVYYAWCVIDDDSVFPNFEKALIGCVSRSQAVVYIKDLTQQYGIKQVYFAGNAFSDVLFFDLIRQSLMDCSGILLEPLLSMPTLDDLHAIYIDSVSNNTCSCILQEQLVEPLYIKKAI